MIILRICGFCPLLKFESQAFEDFFQMDFRFVHVSFNFSMDFQFVHVSFQFLNGCSKASQMENGIEIVILPLSRLYAYATEECQCIALN